jgi:hypothetical protein
MIILREILVVVQGGAMKSSKRIPVQTTLGELVSALWEEAETLFKFKRNEKKLVVAYVLNDLLARRRLWKSSNRQQKKIVRRTHNRGRQSGGS